MIEFEKAYFIRLGRKNKWAEECISKGIIRLGYNSPMHNNCINGKWSLVEKYWVEQGKTTGKAKDYTNQIRKFYTADKNILWVTFFNRKLYYAFSYPEITEVSFEGERERKTISPWSCLDIKGQVLSLERLSSKLTKTQGYQGTICEIKETEYLKNKINAKASEIAEIAKNKKENLIKSLVPLIQQLTWYDFELLVDLIFTNSGWRRIEDRKYGQESIDLDLVLPVNGKRAFVQIKSSSDLKEFLEYKDEFSSMEQYSEFYYFVHTPKDKKLEEFNELEENEYLFIAENISELLVNMGLVDWLIEKTN